MMQTFCYIIIIFLLNYLLILQAEIYNAREFEMIQ